MFVYVSGVDVPRVDVPGVGVPDAQFSPNQPTSAKLILADRVSSSSFMSPALL